ncbi:hypothetical protein SRABI80_03732 [Peribacillus frigoritolerans]|uniref:hypothetical protein n=1 Tax=Peribacillus frigoritolerans TaxID=450367 RepID=UPI001DEA33E2|nr:hypothetical protein [Peribacillus frigoritolerans]CAH0281675.1 hypothetical protein SRABI80_03732 [Peribacillus frigoritolerans]
MKPTDRDIKVVEIMEELIAEAVERNYEDKDTFLADLENLFTTTAFGFREVTLVAGIASLLFEGFKCSTGFYECHPRPLYEQSIRSVLIKYSIPHKKSGPLNVAKGSNITYEWAEGKRPKEVAYSVVRIIDFIEVSSEEEIRNFLIALLRRLLDEATRVEEINIDVNPLEDPIFLNNLCQRLIDEATDGGNTPQRIIGYLIEAYHKTLNTGVIVNGHEDSASTTNTTSKKPGDIQEETESQEIFNIYEITVKPFNEQRIQDSHESILEYEKNKDCNIQTVLVICREQDCPQQIEKLNLSFYLGKLEKGHVTYYFINIYEWIMAKLLLIPSTARKEFHTSLNTYISHPNTSEKVKLLWKEIHEV